MMRHSLSQFSTEDTVAFFKSTMPVEELNWKEPQWGAAMLDRAQKLGPLQVRRIKGSWEGTELTVDFYQIKVSYTTELSFEATGLDAASGLRARMTVLLEKEGILLHEDSLKTQTILDSYLEDCPPELNGILP